MSSHPNASFAVVVVTYKRRELLARLVDSIAAQTLRPEKVVVVNNDPEFSITEESLGIKPPFVVVTLNQSINLLAGGGRNCGFEEVREFPFVAFVDDDNILAPDCLERLIKNIREDPNIGMIGPIMLYFRRPDVIWYSGAEVSLRTSLTRYYRLNSRYYPGRLELLETQHIPNFFVVRSSVFRQVGGVHPVFKMHYEESDLAVRIKHAGYRIMVNTGAVTYHDTELVDLRSARRHTIGSKIRAYYVGRNRILFMFRNASAGNFLLFLMVIFPFFIMPIELILAAAIGAPARYLRGVGSALGYICAGGGDERRA